MKNSIWVIWVMTAPLSTTSTAMCSSVCIGPLWWRCLDIIGGASAHGRGCCRWCLYCSGRGERCLLLSSWRSLVGQFTSILSIHYVGTHDNINSTSVAKTMMISPILGTISISYTLSHPNCQCGEDYWLDCASSDCWFEKRLMYYLPRLVSYRRRDILHIKS